MKIVQLLNGVRLPLTNEETSFVKKYKDNISLSSLREHDLWLAQNLVRKGVYSVAEDCNTLIKR